MKVYIGTFMGAAAFDRPRKAIDGLSYK